MAHKDFVRLAALGGEDDLILQEGRRLGVGRGIANIHAAGVSRQHCELWWKQQPYIHVTPTKKRVFISRCPGDLVTVEPGCVNKVRVVCTCTRMYIWPDARPERTPIASAQI